MATDATVDFTPSARIIADSVSPTGVRLSTVEVNLHRFVLAELNTHRAFSRNSASSRAIPVAKTTAAVRATLAAPLVWAGEQAGMQGGEPVTDCTIEFARDIWLDARDDALRHAEALSKLGVHKSVTNRLLEPFMITTVIISATEWFGFFRQRCSPMAQPEIRAAAEAIRDARAASTPRPVDYHDWHLPYIGDELADHGLDAAKRISVARCARVSYLNQGRRDVTADLALYDRLVRADPPHASPLEHVATPTPPPGRPTAHSANFVGWCQLRHMIGG